MCAAIGWVRGSAWVAAHTCSAAKRSDGRLPVAELSALRVDVEAHTSKGVLPGSGLPCLREDAFPAIIVVADAWGDRGFMLGRCNRGREFFTFFRDDETFSWVPTDATINILKRHLPPT